MRAFRYSVKTMGCKANLYDSLVIDSQLAELGGVQDDASPDIFVLNSCTVTAEADRQCRWEIAQVKKRAPRTWTVLAGCYPQAGGNAPEGVDLVVGNDRKASLQKAVSRHLGIGKRYGTETETETGTANRMPFLWGKLPMGRGRTRAFLKIQEGCDHRCTYCIIPYARGASRSIGIEAILAEIRRLVGAGCREVVLTGTNLGDYGGRGDGLAELIDAILEETEIARLRLSSLDPTEITDRILSRMYPGGRLLPHVHVSLQSPVDRVLRAMRRGYGWRDVAGALLRIHARGNRIFVGMDVIAGFPGETRAEHEQAVRALAALPWTRLHVFPYSEREGTPATRIQGKAPMAERKRRARELMSMSLDRHERFASAAIGTELRDVLFENWHEVGGDFFIAGHTANFLRVLARVPSRRADDAARLANTIGRMRVVGISPRPAQDWTLEGVVC